MSQSNGSKLRPKRTPASLLSCREREAGPLQNPFIPLKRRNLENFLDFDKAVQRLKAISSNAEAAEADRQLASELLIAVEQDKDG